MEVRKAAKLGGIMVLAVFQVGFGTGIAGFFPVLQTSGVYGARCANNAFPCNEQLQSISKTTNFAFTFMNAITLLTGVLVDLFGGRKCAMAALVLFGVGVTLTGVSPDSGHCFSAGFILFTSVSTVTFLSLMGHYIPLLGYEHSTPYVLVSGAWDLATVVYPVLRIISETFHPSLFELSAAYGITISLLGILFLHFCFRNKSDEPTKEKQMSCHTVLTQLAATSRAMKTLVFWALVANATMTVGYSYIWMATVEQYAMWKGKGDAVYHYVTIFGWLLPLGGFAVSVALGSVVHLGRRRGLTLALIFQACVNLAMLICVVYASIPVTFALFVIWRVMAFCIINSCVGFIFGFGMMGRVAGSVYTIAGMLSILIDHHVLEYVGVPEPGCNRMLLVHTVGCLLSAGCAIFFALASWMTLDEYSRLFPEDGLQVKQENINGSGSKNGYGSDGGDDDEDDEEKKHLVPSKKKKSSGVNGDGNHANGYGSLPQTQ